MNSTPAFSIVTPSFNQAAFIEEALLSVRQQGGDNIEHLVLDGASRDGTIAILRRHAEESRGTHLRWLSEPDHGQSDALNKGFDSAKGEIVGWLNSDDRYRPGCFEYIARVFRQHPEVDVVYGDYTWIDEAGHVFRIRREIEFSYFVLLHHRVPYIASTAAFFRRRIFDDGNRLDEHLHYAMDYEFFVRLAARGYRFLHVPAILADFRFQPASKTVTAADRQAEEIDAIMHRYSPVLCKLQKPLPRSLAVALLRSSAAIMRYSEKLFRGYYLTQFRPATLNP